MKSFLQMFTVTLFIFILAGFAWADSNFNQAKALITKQQSAAALKLLHPAISANRATPGEWQLTAIATWNAYGSDSLAFAIRAATIAYRLSPSQETRQLLNWLKHKTPSQIEGLPEIALFRIINNAIIQIPAWILLVLCVLGAIIVGIRIVMWREEYSNRLRFLTRKPVVITGFSIFLLSQALSLWQHRTIVEPAAFVTQNGITVFTQPDLGAKELTSLSIGTEVHPISLFGRWQEIQLADGRKGWVQSSTLLHIVM